MATLVINEIFRRISVETDRIDRERLSLGWFHLLQKRALWAKKQTFQRKRDALQNEQWLLEQGSSPDPCVLILGEVYQAGNRYQEEHINSWLNE